MCRRIALAMLLAACDAGVPPPVERTPAPVPHTAVAVEHARARPTASVEHIDWEVGGLGTWRGQIFGGMMCHVESHLSSHRVAVTDPDGTTYQTLSAASERQLRDLATVVRTEPVVPTSDACTDRSETLRVDDFSMRGSCPITQPGAAALIAVMSAYCKAPP
jgi:hypothetical protein